MFFYLSSTSIVLPYEALRTSYILRMFIKTVLHNLQHRNAWNTSHIPLNQCFEHAVKIKYTMCKIKMQTTRHVGMPWVHHHPQHAPFQTIAILYINLRQTTAVLRHANSSSGIRNETSGISFSYILTPASPSWCALEKKKQSSCAYTNTIQAPSTIGARFKHIWCPQTKWKFHIWCFRLRQFRFMDMGVLFVPLSVFCCCCCLVVLFRCSSPHNIDIAIERERVWVCVWLNVNSKQRFSLHEPLASGWIHRRPRAQTKNIVLPIWWVVWECAKYVVESHIKANTYTQICSRRE